MDRTHSKLAITLSLFGCLGFACTEDANDTTPGTVPGDAVTGIDRVVSGSGRLVQESRMIPPADHIIVRASLDVVIFQREAPRLRLEADDNIVPLINSDTSGKTLTLDITESFHTSSPVRAYLELPEISSVSVEGSGGVTLVDIAATTLHLSIPGSADIAASGSADALRVSVSGAGNVDASRLTAREVSVVLAGSGNIAVFADGRLTVNLTGAGNVRVGGDPEERNIRIDGAGDVTFD